MTQYENNAKVVDGKLVLSFPNAKKPVVWQMDVSTAETSALEISDKKKSGHALVFKTPNGEAINIAFFDTADQALQSLMMISSALENSSSQPCGNKKINKQNNQTKRKSGILKLFAWIIAILVILFITSLILSSIKMQTITTIDGTSQTAANPNDTIGVPLSADAFLNQ